jgi:hypothetical protein
MESMYWLWGCRLGKIIGSFESTPYKFDKRILKKIFNMRKDIVPPNKFPSWSIFFSVYCIGPLRSHVWCLLHLHRLGLLQDLETLVNFTTHSWLSQTNLNTAHHIVSNINVIVHWTVESSTFHFLHWQNRRLALRPQAFENEFIISNSLGEKMYKWNLCNIHIISLFVWLFEIAPTK